MISFTILRMVIILFVNYFVMWYILKYNLLNNFTSCFIRLVSLQQAFWFRNCLKDNLCLMISLNKLICGRIPCSKEPISVDFSWSCWSLIKFFASSFHITSYEITMVAQWSGCNRLGTPYNQRSDSRIRSVHGRCGMIESVYWLIIDYWSRFYLHIHTYIVSLLSVGTYYIYQNSY